MCRTSRDSLSGRPESGGAVTRPLASASSFVPRKGAAVVACMSVHRKVTVASATAAPGKPGVALSFYPRCVLPGAAAKPQMSCCAVGARNLQGR